MKNKLLLFLIVFLFNCLTASAQLWLWGEQGSTGKKTDLFARDVATNITGNVYHTGGFETSVIFVPDTLKAVFEDVFLVKYDPNGNVLWARQSETGQSAPNGYSVASDDSDNSYVTGYAGDGTVFGPDTLKGSGGGFLVKYDPNGNVVWLQPSNFGDAVATDRFGHEFVTGGGFLTKFDRNGNVIWTETQAGGYSDATDPLGNVYIAGTFQDSLIIGTYKLYSTNTEIFIIKFDPNANVIWANQSVNNSGSNMPFNSGYGGYSVAADNSGSAYLTGIFDGSILFGSYIFEPGTQVQHNFFVVKYYPDGAIAWGKQATVPSDGDWGTYSICADGANHIFISGAEGNSFSQANYFAFGVDTFRVSGSGNDNPSFLLELDTLGYVICGATLTAGGQYPNAVAADSSGRFVYMGGGFIGNFVIGSDSLNDNSGGYNTYVARWKPCSNCNLVVTIPPPSPICDGQNIMLTVDGAKSYAWSPATGLNVATGDTVVASPTLTTTYTIFSSATGCKDTGQIVIDVKPLPDFSLSPPTPSICNGQFVVLTANGDSSDISYTWNPATGLSGTTGSSIVAISSVTTTYTVAAMLNGCLDSEQIVVHVGAPIVTILPPNPSVCPGQSILLVASGATTYVWSPTQSLNTAIGDTVVATPSIQTTYTVVGTISGGCSGFDTDVVSIELGLNTPTITQRGDTLFSSATQGNQWVRNDTLIPGATNVFYVITESGWYKVLAINPANGCSTASDSAYFTQTGISQLAINSEQLSVYPNPTGGAVFVNISSSVAEIKDWSLQITDVLGRTVYARQALNYSNAIDISNLSSGVYFITVVNKTGRAVVPVVKQ